MNKTRSILTGLLLFASLAAVSAGALSIKDSVSEPGDFSFVIDERAAPIFVDKNDAEVVRIAATLLAIDVERVTGVKPKVRSDAVAKPTAAVVIVGTLGKSGLIADLVKRGKLDIKGIEGKWESFVAMTVADPFPEVASALVIVGSDRRGTAYGIFEVSEAIGVSPWVWWADVAPRHRQALVVGAGTHTVGPPSVKYRGIFINDEDWGLKPWAAKTFEPETGDIGPKTYAKVCELLLRLKANYLWPAMHDCTKAFNHYPENKHVADRFAIVMGSSHCEPMLRNNVDEWDWKKNGDWNPVKNLKGISEYWESRVRENGKFENTYTTGMRGIHDSGMPGGGTIDEKRQRMDKIIGLQREMLTRHVNPDPSQVPQIFCPYKEVLDIYQSGMKLPDDITIVWPDDNFGYIRQLPDARERQRAGGNGIYYHLSYWGRPHDYLWLESTSPALIWHEMTKAYELGARQLWVVNVGDIKPIEAGMTLFLKLAWDINRYGQDVQRKFLRDFYAAQFEEEHAEAIACLSDEYFRLCAIRRPEHMGFNRVYSGGKVKNTPVQNSNWSHAPENDEAQALLDRWLKLARSAEALAGKLPLESRDAYFQLVEYPACAGAAMVEKFILAEKARLFGSDELAQRAEAALRRIEQLTGRYNAQCDGKWRGMMDHRPRRLPVFDMPLTMQMTNSAMQSAPQTRNPIVIDPTKFDQSHDRNGAGWRAIEGLGPRGGAIAVLPRTDVPTLRSPQEIRERAPVAEYTVAIKDAREVDVILEALPTYRLTPAHEVLAAVSVNDGEPVLVRFDQGKDDEDDPTWQRNVLRNAMSGTVSLRVPEGASKLKLWAADPGVVVQRITLDHKPLTTSVSVPAESLSEASKDSK